MTSKITFLNENFITMNWYGFSPVCILITFKFFFFILQESLITLVALIRLLSCVFSHIKYKFIILCERLVTFATIIRFFSSVYYKMHFDLIFSEKCLSQWLQWYGFSPVCLLMCVLRWVNHTKALLQWLHWYVIFQCASSDKLYIDYLLKKISYTLNHISFTRTSFNIHLMWFWPQRTFGVHCCV